MASRNLIYAAISRERIYQDKAHGTIQEHPHDVGAWLTIIRHELQEAEDAWCTQPGDNEALKELVQVAALCVATMEQHGFVER